MDCCSHVLTMPSAQVCVHYRTLVNNNFQCSPYSSPVFMENHTVCVLKMLLEAEQVAHHKSTYCSTKNKLFHGQLHYLHTYT